MARASLNLPNPFLKNSDDGQPLTGNFQRHNRENRSHNREYDQAHQATRAVSRPGGRIPGGPRGVDPAARIAPFSSGFNWASLRQSGCKAVRQNRVCADSTLLASKAASDDKRAIQDM